MGILACDGEDKIVHANQAACTLLGADDPVQLEGRPLATLAASEDVFERLDRQLGTREPVRGITVAFHRLDGGLTSLRVTIQRQTSDEEQAGGLVVVLEPRGEPSTGEGSSLPVGDRKELQELRAWKQGITEAADRAGLGLAILISDGGNRRLAFLNEAGSELLGIDPEADKSSLLDLFDAQDLEQLRRRIRGTEGKAGHQAPVTVGVTRSDGETVTVEIGFSYASYWARPAIFMFFRDVSERVGLEEERERWIEELERSNEDLEMFAYAVSHDLKEPLRMIHSYIQLLDQRAREDLDPDHQAFLDEVVQGADRMEAMIGGILEYSRVERKGDPMGPVDLSVPLEAALDSVHVRLTDGDGEVAVPDELPTVHGDQLQLEQLFQNLLSNAIKHSGDAPPRIRVDVKREDTVWHVTVEDHGEGMEPELAERAFDLFSKGSRDDPDSTGVGLALVRRIAERHDGEIWLDTEPGEGTTVHVTLPVTDP